MNFFDKLNDGIRNTEASIVNFLSAIAPWGAPLSPAYMTFSHMVDPRLNYPYWVAFATAVVVEILGLSTINTALAFWSHNKRNKAQKNKAPIWVAVLSFVFYLMVILTSNVILDAFAPGVDWSVDWPVILVRALFALLSVPAVLIMAVRTQHQDLLSEIRDVEEERKREREEAKKEREIERKEYEESLTDRQHIGLLTWRKAHKKLKDDDKLFMLNSKPKEIASEFGISERTALNWKNGCEEMFGKDFSLIYPDEEEIESNEETQVYESYE